MTPLADNEFDDTAMEEAEAALKALAEAYPDYAAADVDQMEATFAALQASAGADAVHLSALYGVAHNIKGQGAAFGYDLMTDLGEALCLQLRDRARLDGGAMAMVARLIDACRTVVTERLTGDGGVFGLRLRTTLGLSVSSPDPA